MDHLFPKFPSIMDQEVAKLVNTVTFLFVPVSGELKLATPLNISLVPVATRQTTLRHRLTRLNYSVVDLKTPGTHRLRLLKTFNLPRRRPLPLPIECLCVHAANYFCDSANALNKGIYRTKFTFERCIQRAAFPRTLKGRRRCGKVSVYRLIVSWNRAHLIREINERYK